MTLPIQFSAEASAELDDAAIWYDEQRSGLGHEFLDVVSETLNTTGLVAALRRSGR